MPAVGSIADAYAAVRAALGHLADARMEVERTEEMLAGLLRNPLAITPIFLGANHTKGRAGALPIAIVIHLSAGTLSSMTSWFRNPASKVSAHYGVGRDGTVLQYVRDEDTAWHAGAIVRPTAALVLKRPGNPNQWTIGIEHEGTAEQEPTEVQMNASAALLRLLAHRHAIPLDRRYIIGHREIRADKECPGKIDVDELVERALGTP